MRFIKLPDFDPVLEFSRQEWRHLALRLPADLILPEPKLEEDGGNYIAHLGGTWILFLVKRDEEPGRERGDE
ncbi:MAG: hypothetical protein QW639_06805 [Candidatus Bathyarchaeia archaeon]